MTEETKRYIAVSDIIALRLSCKTCGATVTRPMKEFKRGIDQQCGNCHTPWSDTADKLHIEAVERMVGLIKQVEHLVKDENFDLSLEIVGPKD